MQKKKSGAENRKAKKQTKHDEKKPSKLKSKSTL